MLEDNKNSLRLVKGLPLPRAYYIILESFRLMNHNFELENRAAITNKNF